MTSFDELIGAEPAGTERERLRKVHELLVEVGPPPEVTPEIASGPTLAMTLGRVRRMKRSRRMLIPLVAAAALVALIIGISGHGRVHGVAIPLRGTAAAPSATGTLTVLNARAAKPPMRIEVRGLAPGNYAVFLVRNGRPVAECGSFVVKSRYADTTQTLTSPYRLQADETWVVTQESSSSDAPGVTVLSPRT